MTGIRVVYSDLDGTMLGPYGSLFLDAAERPTELPARTLTRLHAAGVPLVLVSGRTRVQLREAARILGADGFVAELGAVLGWDRGFATRMVEGLVPPAVAREASALLGRDPDDDAATLLPTQVMAALGVLDALLDRWEGRVEWHTPWHTDRETDAMLRGRLDLAQVRAWLADSGWSWLDVLDNGVLPLAEPPPGVASGLAAGMWPPRVYHVVPAGVTKGTGVGEDLARRGLRPDQAVAVGDSVSDLTMAPFVRELWLVANAAADPDVVAAARAHDNVRFAGAPLGAGWAQAVTTAVLGDV